MFTVCHKDYCDRQTSSVKQVYRKSKSPVMNISNKKNIRMFTARVQLQTSIDFLPNLVRKQNASWQESCSASFG